VVVDTNHRAAGQAMELEVLLFNIQALGDDQATEGQGGSEEPSRRLF